LAERTAKGSQSTELVGQGLDPVSLARRMLDLGATEFEVGDVRVVFGEAAVSEAAARRAPRPEPLDAATAKRLRDEAEERARTEALEVELWSVQ
jgi:hypothetical protein